MWAVTSSFELGRGLCCCSLLITASLSVILERDVQMAGVDDGLRVGVSLDCRACAAI